MKIALLNLPFDSNFGGNLQRYALITFIKNLGYDIEHINLRYNYKLPWYKVPFSYSKRIIKKLIFRDSRPILLEQQMTREAIRKNKAAETFYNRYIPHTKVINNKKELNLLPKYDVYIVGSDQVWRKSMTQAYNLKTYFFDFIRNSSSIKIAYGASFGSDQNELTSSEIKKLGELYNKFSAVSVREQSAIQLLNSYKWTTPQAITVLDPAFLLTKEDYIELINKGTTSHCSGNLFCYILDNTEKKEQTIQNTARSLNLKPFRVTLNNENTTIEQWIRSFQDAEYIITDSYHGLIFSIIFNKPFTLIKNEKRGNTRFESLLETLEIKTDKSFSWDNINERIEEEKKKAIKYLLSNLPSIQ